MFPIFLTLSIVAAIGNKALCARPTVAGRGGEANPGLEALHGRKTPIRASPRGFP